MFRSQINHRIDQNTERGQALFEYAIYLSFMVVIAISVTTVLRNALEFTFITAIVNRDKTAGIPPGYGGQIGSGTANNQPPVVQFETAPDPPIVASGQTITFISTSFDPDEGDQIESHVWDIYGDGSVIKEGATVTHTFTTSDPQAIFQPKLTVTDNHGSSVSQKFSTGAYTTSPPNLPPVAVINVSQLSGPAPLEVTFTSSSYDSDGSVVTHAWDFGAGTGTKNGTTEVYTYDTPGDYAAMLTITDDGGATTNSYRVYITVQDSAPPNQAPTVAISSSTNSANTGQTIQFFTDSLSDPDGTIEYYQWDMGDGSDLIGPAIFTGVAPVINHAYDAAGTYTARMTVTDNGGFTASDTVVISIGSAPAPTPTPSPTPTPIPVSDECNFEAEYATLSGPSVKSNHSGYSGTGFADYPGGKGADVYIEWNVNVASAGTYHIDFHYALSGGNRPLEYRVNGSVIDGALPFPSTGGWGSWGTSDTFVYLNAGSNTIRITALNNSGPNLDCIAVYP